MVGNKREPKYQTIDMEPCTREHFKLMGVDKYDKIKILNEKNFICPTLNQVLQVEGLYTSEIFAFLKVSVTKCNNSFLNFLQGKSWRPIECPSEQEYKDFLKKTKNRPRLLFYTSNYNINPTETQKFSEPFIQDQQSFTFIPNMMVKNADIFIKPYIISTDESIIQEDTKEINTYIICDMEDTVQTQEYNLESDVFVNLFLRRSSHTIYIKRDFKKLAELMYQIGGLVKFVFIFIGYFANKYNEFQCRLELSNKLYDFQLSNQQDSVNNNQLMPKIWSAGSLDQFANIDNHAQISLPDNQIELKVPQQEKKLDSEINDQDVKKQTMDQFKNTMSIFRKLDKKKTVKQKDIKINVKSDADLIDQSSMANNMSADVLKKVNENENKSQMVQFFQSIISRSQKIKFSISYICNILTCRKCFNSERNYIIKKAIDFTKRDLDIYIILDKLQEIEKIKKILFNSDQITLFNFFPKPIIKKELKLYQNKSLREFNMQKKRHSSKINFITDEQNDELSGDNLLKERDNFSTVQAYQLGEELRRIFEQTKNCDASTIKSDRKHSLKFGKGLYMYPEFDVTNTRGQSLNISQNTNQILLNNGNNFSINLQQINQSNFNQSQCGMLFQNQNSMIPENSLENDLKEKISLQEESEIIDGPIQNILQPIRDARISAISNDFSRNIPSENIIGKPKLAYGFQLKSNFDSNIKSSIPQRVIVQQIQELRRGSLENSSQISSNNSVN